MMGTCLWHCVGPDKESPAETMYTFIVSIDCEDTGDNRTHCLSVSDQSGFCYIFGCVLLTEDIWKNVSTAYNESQWGPKQHRNTFFETFGKIPSVFHKIE